MNPHRLLCTLPAAALLGAVGLTAAPADPIPLAIAAARVTLSGTSALHPYRASTDTVRITRVKLARPTVSMPDWDAVTTPGTLEAFEIAIPAATLTSGDGRLDADLHQALKMDAHQEITFRLSALEQGASGMLLAVGKLRVAGVEREVVLPLDLQRRDRALVVAGRVPLLMTDYGITPPATMLGPAAADAKVIVAFEIVLTTSGT